MTSRDISILSIGLVLLSAVPKAAAQSLGDVAKKAAEERAQPKPTADTPATTTRPPAKTSGAKVYTNDDLPAGESSQADSFTPTKDAVFVCKARSMKALFKAVEAEHHGVLAAEWADITLRKDKTLADAAKMDADSCEAGTYSRAMEKALKAKAEETARLGKLLQGVK
jgi:hypothetical protein